MADSRFFRREGPFTLAQLASRIEAEVAEGADTSIEIADVAPLDSAQKGELSFLDNPKYAPAFKTTKASACIVAPKFLDQAPKGISLLISHQPYRSYALAAQAFYPDSVRPLDTFGDPGTISAQAHVHASAQIGEGVTIEPGAVVSAGVEIGSGSVISSAAVLAKNVTVGRNS
ncbi:MAG: hypothetical protein JKY63_06350 [Rhodobiaceae bacterium]|nr:hypothetical protein [Rhodobiaceae bacterium]